MKSIISLVILVALAVIATQLIRISRTNQQLRADIAEVNHIKYSLLNVDEWADQLKQILNKKIREFQITPANQESLQSGIQNILFQLIDEVELLMEKRTEGQFSRIKRWVADMAIDIEQLRDSVPVYSIQIMDELENPNTKDAIRDVLSDKLDQYISTTNSAVTMKEQEQLMEKYDAATRMEATANIRALIAENMVVVNRLMLLLIAGILLIYLLAFSPKTTVSYLQMTMLVLASLVLLVAGVSLPMIQLEAKIDLVQFELLGEHMRFRDNILYYQSKSIIEMVEILVRDGSLRMIFVGSLIFMFSLIFPSLKLLSTMAYQSGNKRVNRNRLVRFFVLKSGKWSMADVMVVAIFMAYIGFNGIVDNQMKHLAGGAEPVEVFTTNGTQLLPGFYLFLTFVLSGLVLSEIVKRSNGSKLAGSSG
ncbi:MAG: paraquat-inducible protein A [Bacteroidales bacterium]|nr:paraquat-inducible protein A [Bacteroidales bacterium]MDT8432591.1 paraquat-inducible protein A [Bacteroidales bacterium]